MAVDAQPNPQKVSDARFKQFTKEFEQYEAGVQYRRTLDTILDLFSAYTSAYDISGARWQQGKRGIALRIMMLIFEAKRLHRKAGIKEPFEMEFKF